MEPTPTFTPLAKANIEVLRRHRAAERRGGRREHQLLQYLSFWSRYEGKLRGEEEKKDGARAQSVCVCVCVYVSRCQYTHLFRQAF